MRIATRSDVARLVEMGERFIAETAYREFIAFNREALEALMAGMIGKTNCVIFVEEVSTSIVGMLGMHVYRHPMSNERVAAEAFWWVEPEHRKSSIGIDLLTRGEAWAKANAATKIQMIAPNDRVGRLYKTRGYRKFEEQYQRDLS